MAEGTGGGGFGIWMINQHGSDGHFYGGPEVFFGAVIVGAVFPVNGTREIRFRCVQSSFTIRATPMAADEEASYVMPLDDSWFVLRLDVSSTHIALSKVVDDQVSLLLNESLTLDLSEAWLGLTGLSADRTSRIELNYAKFGDSALREGILAQQRKVGSRSQRVLPLTNRELRNPIFSLMLSELEQWKAADGQIGNLSKDFDQVFAHLNEFWTVFEDVATYKQLSSFVKKTLIPYAQDWHRRAFKVVESVSEAKIILSKAFNKTAALVSVFNESVSEMVEKTDRKVVRLRELVIGDENDAFSGLRNVGHEIGVVGFVDVLKWIGFSEIGILTLFYIYQSVAGRNRR
jgi:hypothetical protein